jgi:hypothetical protein
LSFTASTIRQRKRLAEAQDGFCPACGSALPDDLADTEVDHIIPRVRGGPNAPWNRRLVHFLCNRRKKDKLTDEAIALAAAYGLTLIEPGASRRRPVASVQEPEEIPWWSWRRHLNCGQYNPETGRVSRSDTACEHCMGPDSVWAACSRCQEFKSNCECPVA